MTDDRGNLSVDFLAGFTIFLLAFIWVIAMIPGLMIGLQAYTIDYDAVAYRTGVILAEDPGWPVAPAWESFADPQKYNVTRFGLAISKDTPNILSQDKVNRFFNVSTTNPSVGFIYPDDYQKRVIFGDFPYRFRISLRDLDNYRTRTVGEQLPDDYGYIRRVVKIKGTSNATINKSYMTSHSYIKTDNVTTHVFSILINNTKLLNEIRDPAYQIDPSREQLSITVADLNSICPGTAITLNNVKIYKLDSGIYSNVPLPASNNPFVDGSSTRLPSSWPATPAAVNNNVTIRFNPQYIDSMKAQNSQIFVAMMFEVTPACTFLNNTQVVPDYDNLVGKDTFENLNTTPFDYNYHPDNVTQPKLRDAVLAVAVWSGETVAEPMIAIFADGFETSTASDDWIPQSGNIFPWYGTPHYGNSSIVLRDTPTYITRTIPTTGYSDITVSFEMGMQTNNAGHYLSAEWSSDGGATWNLLKQINHGDPEDDNQLHPFSYQLPASADNNANFTLRFSLEVDNINDKGFVDNVQVGGNPY
jgi:hypothetical protein